MQGNNFMTIPTDQKGSSQHGRESSLSRGSSNLRNKIRATTSPSQRGSAQSEMRASDMKSRGNINGSQFDRLATGNSGKTDQKRANSPRRITMQQQPSALLGLKFDRKGTLPQTRPRNSSAMTGDGSGQDGSSKHQPNTNDIMQVQSQLQNIVKNKDFNLSALSKQYQINSQHTQQLMDLMNVNRSDNNMGRSSISILMKNPILRGLKKFLLKDQQIKNVMAQKSTLMEIINKIKPLQTLCQPTKNRFRNLMQMQQVDIEGTIPVTDVQHSDLIYIEKGCLEVCFEMLSYKSCANHQHGNKTAKCIGKSRRVVRFSTGDYIDFTWKMNTKELKDRVIKYVKCVPYDPCSEVSIRERIPVEQQMSRKNLRRNISKQNSKHGGTASPVSVKSVEAKQDLEISEESSESNSSQNDSVHDSQINMKEASKMWKMITERLKMAEQEQEKAVGLASLMDKLGQKANEKSEDNQMEQEDIDECHHEHEMAENAENAGSCTFVKVPYAVYKEFVDFPAGKNQRNVQNMTEILRNTLPYFANITVKKGQNILNEFEEMEYVGGPGGVRPGTVLEHEGQQGEYMYLLLRGEIHFYKRILGLYTEVEQNQPGQPQKIGHQLMNIDSKRPLDNFVNLKDSSNRRVGMFLGSLKGIWNPNQPDLNCSVIAGDDSSIFMRPNEYTLVAGENTLLFRFPLKNAFQIWPADTVRKLQENSDDKYRWLQQRMSNIQAQLFKNIENKAILDISKRVDDRTRQNYPNANQRAQQVLKEDNMKQADWNEKIYVGLQNRRIQGKYNCLTGDENNLIEVVGDHHHDDDDHADEPEQPTKFKIRKDGPKGIEAKKYIKGAVNQQFLKRLERIKSINITGEQDLCYLRSETLEQLAVIEQSKKKDNKNPSKIHQSSAQNQVLPKQKLITPQGSQINTNTSQQAKFSFAEPLYRVNIIKYSGSQKHKVAQKLRNKHIQVASTFSNIKCANYLTNKPKSAYSRQKYDFFTKEKMKTMNQYGQQHQSLTQNRFDQVNTAQKTQFEQASKSVAHDPMPNRQFQTQYQKDNQSPQSQINDFDSDGQSKINLIAVTGATPTDTAAISVGMFPITPSSHLQIKKRVRTVSQSPPTAPTGASQVQKSTNPSMLNVINKKESMNLSGAGGNSANVSNMQNNISFQNDSKITYLYQPHDRFEFANQQSSQNVPNEMLNETGEFQNMEVQIKSGSEMKNQYLQSPKSKAQNFEVSRAEHSVGKASQDSASINHNDKVVMSSKNMNLADDSNLHQKTIGQHGQSQNSNTKSYGTPGTFNSTTQGVEARMYQGVTYQQQMIKSGGPSPFKSRSSEYIMSNATINAINDRKRQSQIVKRSQPGDQMNGGQILVGMKAEPTPKSLKTRPIPKNFSGYRRNGHARRLTQNFQKDSQTFTILNEINEQHQTKTQSTTQYNAFGDIRPGSIYSSHQHARRKFQMQQNIRTNRNCLMMQNSMNQAAGSHSAISRGQQFLRKKIVRSTEKTRPKTQGQNRILVNNVRLVRGFTAAAHQGQPQSRQEQGQGEPLSLNPQQVSEFDEHQQQQFTNQIAVNGILINNKQFYDLSLIQPQIPTNVQIKQINDDQGLILNNAWSVVRGQEKSTRSCAVVEQSEAI